MQCLKLKIIVEGEVQFSICHTDNKDSRWNDERLTAHNIPHWSFQKMRSCKATVVTLVCHKECIALWFARVVLSVLLSDLSDLSVCCVREIAGICVQGDALEWKWTRRTSLSISVLVLTELPSYRARVCTGNIYIKPNDCVQCAAVLLKIVQMQQELGQLGRFGKRIFGRFWKALMRFSVWAGRADCC